MGNESTINVAIKVDPEKGIISVKQFGSETEKSLALVETKAAVAGKAIDQTSGSCATLGSAAEKLQTMLIAAFSIEHIIRFSDECVTAASRLEETNNKFSVVFTGQSILANRWSTELVNSYQMSEEAGKAYLSTITNMLWAMGMASDEAGKLGFEIVKLSADMSSFHNIPVAQVMGDIESALAGQYDTMKKYGVVLMETTVSQKALTMGLAKTKDELTAADKAQAALKIITEASGTAIGDIARSYDSYANTARRATAETENLSAAIGEKLLPTLTKLKGGWSDFAGDVTRYIRNSTDDQIRTLELQIEGLEKGAAGVKRNIAAYGEIYGNFVINKNNQQIAELKKVLEALKAQQTSYEQDVSALQAAARINGGTTATPAAPAANIGEDAGKRALDEYKQLAEGIQVIDQMTYQIKMDYIRTEYTERMKSLAALGAGSTKYAQAMVALEQWRVNKVKELNDQLAASRTNYDFQQTITGGTWAVQGLQAAENAQAAKVLDEGSAALIRRNNSDMKQASTDFYAYLKDTETSWQDNMKSGLASWRADFAYTLNDMVWGADASFTHIAKSFGKMITEVILEEQLVKPIASSIGLGIDSIFASITGSAYGNVFSMGRKVTAYASGDIITQPIIFPMANGYGLAGEAGYEAIMPVKRMNSGRLGVETSGSGGTYVTVNVHNNGSTTQANVEQTQDNFGNLQLDVYIDELVSNKLTRGKSAGVLRRVYGLKPVVTRR